MKKSKDVFSLIKRNRLIALLTPESVQQCVVAYEILNSHDIILEIAFRSEYALEGIKAVLKKYPDALVLAGTVMTSQQADSAIEAGAAGIISADYFPSVVESCIKKDVMCVPGGLNDAGKQLMQKAEIYGCDLDDLRNKYPYQWIYKLFPALTPSNSYYEVANALRGPFKDLNIIYTGGVNFQNIGNLVEFDPNGIYCASSLTKSINQPDVMKEELEKWKSEIDGSLGRDEKKSKNDRKHETEPGVVTFGEIMLRLSPPAHSRLVQTNIFNATFGGAEANVSVSLANFGVNSTFVSAVPENEIGQSAFDSLRAKGVNTEFIINGARRLGIYYLEHGASQRPSKVIYDRAGSSFSEIKSGQFDWNKIFKSANWFHFTGITPALGDSVLDVTVEALKAARDAGITISVDLNYRKKLWSSAKACSVMTKLMNYIDICFANEEDAEQIFGIKAGSTDVDSGLLEESAYEDVAKQLLNKFGLKKVVITLRKSISASDNLWSACLFNGSEFLKSKEYSIHIVDRVGSGDAFCAGFIYGVISGKPDQEALEFGAAASCLKQTIHGDFNLVTVDEVERLVSGQTSGRVQR
ncbi:MAG: KHG/KDPG aldolase/sugar kinase fusion protein [Candidatus Electryonea clarkiae]|nr:KHG/KDPG aldolase/sugar kinase fusion protein [Candidatus Electryonea clarkiae]MDP8289218.1 KHG/KDPG aldolase/sugar kinase fusion protein [Candidatus Electryonea clarkiae]